MTKRRAFGEGTVDARGENSWRLRYRVNGQRFTTTFRGTRAEARAELRRRLRDGDVGLHVPPDRMTVAQWLEHWIGLGCRGKRQGKPRPHTVERYRQLISHAIPVLGGYRLQKLAGADLDQFYATLAGKLAPGTQHQAHIVLRAALAAAVRAGAGGEPRGASPHGTRLRRTQPRHCAG